MPRGSYTSLFVPVLPRVQNTVTLGSSATFPIPGMERERSFLIKNITFENLSRTDLFTRGWHQSGYLFALTGVDQDGWTGRETEFRFPATDKHRTATIDVVRYPARTDLPVTISVNGQATIAELPLEQNHRFTVPLSATGETVVRLSTERVYELSAADPRQRSFRIVNIGIE